MNNTFLSFFNRIFSNRRSASQEAPESKESENNEHLLSTREYAQLMKFSLSSNTLLMAKFLARSDYRRPVEEFSEPNNFFQNQKAAKKVGNYCSANGVLTAKVESFLRNYADMANLACFRQHEKGNLTVS